MTLQNVTQVSPSQSPSLQRSAAAADRPHDAVNGGDPAKKPAGKALTGGRDGDLSRLDSLSAGGADATWFPTRSGESTWQEAAPPHAPQRGPISAGLEADREELARYGLLPASRSLPEQVGFLSEEASDRLHLLMALACERACDPVAGATLQEIGNDFAAATRMMLRNHDEIAGNTPDHRPGSRDAQRLVQRVVAGARVVAGTMIDRSSLTDRERRVARHAVETGVQSWLGQARWDNDVVNIWPGERPLVKALSERWRPALWQRGSDSRVQADYREGRRPLFPPEIAAQLTRKISAMGPDRQRSIGHLGNRLHAIFDHCLTLSGMDSADAERWRAIAGKRIADLVNKAVEQPDRTHS